MELKLDFLLSILPSKFVIVLVCILLILLSPFIIYFLLLIIKAIFKFVCHIILWYWYHFSPKQNNDNNKESLPFTINNQHQPYHFKDKDLTLIEIKMLELNQKEQQQKQYDLFKIELEQNKTQTKIDLNQQKYYFENKLLEQKIDNLEKELQRIICQQKTTLNIDKNEEIQKETEIKNYTNINFSILDKELHNQIPIELKQIFAKVTNIENIQLFILKNIIEQKSYYDQEQNVLYVHPNDLIFIKILLIEHKKIINPNKKIL